jgi:outer membrane receptor for ferric coprogen and ferric-rhodotorulic acid
MMRAAFLVSTAFALIPSATLAKEGERPDALDSSNDVIVYGRGEEKNTLATGLSLSPRETPQSISVITREQMEDQAAITIGDMLAYTSGVSLKAVDRGRSTLSARGFDITNFQIDGAPFNTGNIGLEKNSSAIYERIEVIRGASGLLQGAGDPSATINLVRKHAVSSAPVISVDLELGTWNRMAATGDLTLPLTTDGSVRMRLVGQIAGQDSFVDLEKTDSKTIYAVVDADPGTTTHISIGASYQRDDRKGVLWGQLPYWYSDGTRTDWPRSKTTATSWNRWNTVEKTAFLMIDQKLGDDWSLRGDVSYHQQDEDSKLLWTSGLPNRATGIGMNASGYWYNSNPKQWNASLMLRGGFNLLGQAHELILGANYRRRQGGWSDRTPPELAPIGDFNNWNGAAYPEPSWGPRFWSSGHNATQQYAGYGAAKLQFLDPLKLILGARISWWRRDEKASFYTPSPFIIRHNGRITPYAGVVFDMTKNLSAYASYTSIFDPQERRDRNGAYLPPLLGNSYEAGLKSEWMGGRLRGSAAIFRIEQDNFGVVDADGAQVPGTTSPAYHAAKGTVSEGYEAEIAGKMLPQWDLSLGWSAFRARDANGDPVHAHHPRKVLRMATRYDFAGMAEGFSLGGSLRWESRPPKTAQNPVTNSSEPVGQPAYLLVNAMGRYTLNEHVALQVNVNNLFDKRYFNNNEWFAGYVYGEPRNVRATLRFDF